MKRKTLFMMLVSFSTMAVLTVSVLVGVGKTKKFASKTSANDTYTQTLNSSIFSMSSLTTDYQTNVQQSFGASLPLVMNYSLAKKDGSGNLVLAPAGKVFNYSSSATYKGRITNIKSVTVTYTGGTLYLQEGLAGDATTYGEKSVIASGVEKELLSSPNYVMLTNSVAATTITSLTVEYSCSLAGWEVERLGELYNGMGSDGNVYTLTRNGNNVSVAGQNGTITLDNLGNFTITLAGGAIVYTGSVSEDYKTLSFSEKSGAGAGSAPSLMKVNRVYTVDDFESYTADGTTFTSNPSHANAQSLVYLNSITSSDLRGAYYSDFGGGGNNTWVKGSNFQIPTSGDFLNLTTASKHSGSKAGRFKASTGGWMRHWNREIFDQSQHYNFGSGNKFSFWAHGGYTNEACTTDATQKVEVRLNVYYRTDFELDNDNRNSATYGTGVKTLYINAGTDWKEYTIDIDPSKKVYGYNIMFNNSGLSANQYVCIDDISVYTQPVFERQKIYEETDTLITKSYHGSVNMSVMGSSYTFTVKVALGANGFVAAHAGADMEAQSYSISGDQITIVTTGSYSGKTFGTWVGTLSNNKKTITIPKSGISGTITDFMTSTSITLNENDVLIDGSEGNLAGLEAKIKRQYKDNDTWKDDPGNSDRLAIKSDYYMEGSNSVSIRPYSSGPCRIVPLTTLTEAHDDYDSVGFWVYAPAGVSYTVSIFAYKTEDCTGTYQQCTSKTYSDTDNTADGLSGWHYVESGLYNSTGFGKSFSITINSCSKATIVDYVTYF